MAKRHQLKSNERQRIDSEFNGYLLYKWLKPIVLSWGEETSAFSLDTAEAFYHTICSLDIIFSFEDKEKRLDYCSNLCSELSEYFAEIADDTEDCKKAACLVTGVVDACLYAYNHHLLLDEIIELKTSNKYREKTQEMFKPWLRTDRNSQLVDWLADYLHSDECISVRIGEIVRTMRREELAEKEESLMRQNAGVYVAGNNTGVAAKNIFMVTSGDQIRRIDINLINKIT